MKIQKIHTYLVRPRWGFVEIETSDGLTGWGEAVLEGHTATVMALSLIHIYSSCSYRWRSPMWSP